VKEGKEQRQLFRWDTLPGITDNAMEVEHRRALHMHVHESAIAPPEPQALTEGGQAVVGLPQEMVHDCPRVKDLYQPHGIDLLQRIAGEAFGVRIPRDDGPIGRKRGDALRQLGEDLRRKLLRLAVD
jgi:hypothetical protein